MIKQLYLINYIPLIHQKSNTHALYAIFVAISFSLLPKPQHATRSEIQALTMCKSRKSIQVSSSKSSTSSKHTKSIPSSSSFSTSTTSSSFHTDSTATASFSSSSLALSLREASPVLYPFSELSSAPSVPLSPSTSRLTLRNHDAVLLRRPFISPDPSILPSRLAVLCRSHHRSLARLLGASLSSDDHIHLLYKHVPGVPLSLCLRSHRNPSFTLLPSWLSRMQVASDVAHALQYVHHHCLTVHNRIKSSGIIVTEPDLRAKLCYFGAAELAGEVQQLTIKDTSDEATATTRTNSRLNRFEGTRGYIAPEVLAGGRASCKSDVYAFGVVMLELISGEEPVRYVIGEEECYSRGIREAATEAVEEGRVRGWVDRRLGDSFPVEVAEKAVRVALRCLEEAAEERPDMVWVAEKCRGFSWSLRFGWRGFVFRLGFLFLLLPGEG